MEKNTFGKEYTINYPVYKDINTNYGNILSMANEFLFRIKDNLSGKKVNLIFSGSSGCIISTLFYNVFREVEPEIQVELVYIRKKKEKSHENESLRNFEFENRINIFVDDHIFDGDTISTSIAFVRKNYMKTFKFDYVVVSFIFNRTLNLLEGFTESVFYTKSVGSVMW